MVLNKFKARQSESDGGSEINDSLFTFSIVYIALTA